jgi:hypothetical protein
MKITQIKITKKELDSIPEEDRTLLVLLGHLANELSILHKFLVFTLPRSGASAPESQIRVAHFMLIARIYVGKLLEGWNLLNNIYFRLSKKYEATLSPEGKEYLDKIKKYFSGKNLIYKLRNAYAFHYDTKEMKPQLDLFEETDEFKIIIGGPFANNYYLISEEIITRGMLSQIDKNEQTAIEMLMNNLLDVSKAFMNFIGHCNVAIFELHFSSKQFNQSEIDIGEQPILDKFRIPIFFTRE